MTQRIPGRINSSSNHRRFSTFKAGIILQLWRIACDAVCPRQTLVSESAANSVRGA